MIRRYEPFILKVGEQTGDSYPLVAEFQGASWSGSIPADLPLLTEQEIQQATRWLERGFIDRDYARDLGSRLFQILLPGTIREGFRAADERVAPAGGLRIILTLPPALANLPWELMYDAEGRHGFLARSATAPLVRHFAGMPLPHQPPEEGPLRVLVVTASPRGYPPVSGEQEAAALERNLGRRRLGAWGTVQLAGQHLLRTRSPRGLGRRLRQRSLVEVDVLPHATRQSLQQRTVEARHAGRGYHAVHFVGHGQADERGGQLLLEDRGGRADPVPADEFAELIADPAVNLAVLNACQTAAAVSLFNGVAQATLRRGVPAVVGMQVPILDRAAVEFAREFYGAWAAGEPIEGALAYARRLISAETPGAAADWGIPVLYMGPVEGLSLCMKTVQPPSWPRRLIGLLIALIVTVIPTLYFYVGLLPRGPAVMDGIFNVAVVEFGEQAGKGQPVRISPDAQAISKLVADQLKPLEEDADLRGIIQVQHVSGPIKGVTATERERTVRELAARINATIVIYGQLDVAEPPYTFVPEFYITERLADAEELTGESAFGARIRLKLPLSDDLNRLEAAEKLEPRLEALNFFMLGLAYFHIGKPDRALAYLSRAEAVEGWAPELGKEVLYLFQGSALARQGGPGALEQARAAYRKALDLTDDQYARAYLGLGNLLFDQGTAGKKIDFQLIDGAIAEYRRALTAELKPPTAYMDVKTYFNLGLAYTFKARFLGEDCPDPDAQAALEQAIAAYAEDADVPLVQEIGAKAYYQLGLLHEACGDQRQLEGDAAAAVPLYEVAAEQYRQSIAIAEPKAMQQPGWLGLPIGAPPPKVRELDWQRMRWTARHKLAYTYFVRAEIGTPALYDEAIGEYRQITGDYEKGGGSVSEDLAAEAYYNLGLALERRGEKAQAAEAYRRVQRIAPAGSPLYQRAEERLREVGVGNGS